ncbi:hypothetical protein CTEST_03115 [Corynebacterium testudinoris]|uniref:Uncharacterized protein n=2 Tax=Corynebacterium testudinoris TaxID=136857 RepID=A0A0G3H8B1_9CORY|nr:hypothetical protein CTEST_03115 [Corynebacterium testudinoris]
MSGSGTTLGRMDSSSYHDGSAYDRESVQFYDVAHEGAQIRAIAGVVPDLAALRGLAPRSLVVVATDQVARASARFVVSFRSPLRLPIVVTGALPTYVGPLDVVMVVGDRAEDPEISQELITADRRGAFTILVGPSRGPIVDDAPARTIIIPALPTVVGSSPARTITAVTTVLDLLEEDPSLVEQRLEETAIAIDAELEQLSPERDNLVNPGRQLREFADGARLIHTGASPAEYGIAELVAALWSNKGIPSGAAPAGEMTVEPPREASIFHDPFLDGPIDLIPLKTIIWAQQPEVVSTQPHSLVVSTESPRAGILAGALTLITRGFAATAFDLPEDREDPKDSVEDF